MKTKIIPLALCCVLAVLTSCQKQPIAGFTTDKSTYTAGETVKITNTTTDGSGNYGWGFASSLINSGSTELNPTIIIPENHPDGELAIVLKASSSKGKKSDETSLKVNITAATGRVVFWYNSTGSNATVNINGEVGTINGSYSYPSAPSCGANYCATFTLPVGTYNFTASSSFSNWSGTVTITKDDCVSKLLP